MNIIKKSFFLFSLLFIAFFANAQSANNTATSNKLKSTVEFSVEDIQKIKTLIEQQIKRSISDSEFEAFGKASKENLKLFQNIDNNFKESPFFSQDHVSYLIESMEFRLGLTKPKPRHKSSDNQKKKLKA